MELLILRGLQQDIKIFLLSPILCAIFRFLFIYFFAPNKTYKGQEKKWCSCFNYGFWWGMDFNAYVLLFLFLLVTLPSLGLESIYVHGDSIRVILGTLYFLVVYIAFLGKLIFYYHYKDTYNSNLRLGRNADKRNLLDIFFNQNHGRWILLSLPIYTIGMYYFLNWVLEVETLVVPTIYSKPMYYIVNTVTVIATVIVYYWFRYGGTFKHRNKPEWDTVPEVVKQDMFFAKACIDDLIAFELAIRTKPQEILAHSDAESIQILKPLIKVEHDLVGTIWNSLRRKTTGPRIKKPKKIFLIVEESYSQFAFDDVYKDIPIANAGRLIREQSTTISIDNFLAGGLISQPSISSMLNGIFDVNLELNEMFYFWNHRLPTSLAQQMSKLGYTTSLWYGGSLSWSSLGLFAKANGFQKLYSGFDITPSDTPYTWLGVYDHLFFDGIQKKLQEQDQGTFEFHFIYTTSNHAPYTIPVEKYGLEKEQFIKILPTHIQKYVNDIGTYAYCDDSLTQFVRYIQETYEDSLVIVTGDHTRRLPMPSQDINRVHTLREDISTAFYMSHKDFDKDLLNGVRIGTHMNILPTIMELIAAKEHEYISLFPSLFEQQELIVTPYHWLSNSHIGFFKDQRVETLDGTPVYDYNLNGIVTLQQAYMEVTGAILRNLTKPSV